MLRMGKGPVFGLLGMLLAVPGLAGCAADEADGVQTLEVVARGETPPVGTANDDAADDPAIWRNPDSPKDSLIIGTDKKAGIYVYGMDGTVRHFHPGGRLNNVDLANMGALGVIVVASDRNDPANAGLQIFRLDTGTGILAPLGAVPGGKGEGYGLCLMRQNEALHAFSVLKHGGIAHVAIDLSGAQPRGEMLRMVSVPSQAEGCVVDERTAILYVGEEAAGIWAFDARANGASEGRLIAQVDGAHLVADVEGLALAPDGADGGYIVASSQGDNAFALYELPSFAPAGRFRVKAGTFGSVEETDGIELVLGDFGPDYPGGLFVAQDGDNSPRAQNFKLVAWADVLKALGRQASGQKD